MPFRALRLGFKRVRLKVFTVLLSPFPSSCSGTPNFDWGPCLWHFSVLPRGLISSAPDFLGVDLQLPLLLLRTTTPTSSTAYHLPTEYGVPRNCLTLGIPPSAAQGLASPRCAVAHHHHHYYSLNRRRSPPSSLTLDFIISGASRHLSVASNSDSSLSPTLTRLLGASLALRCRTHS